MGLQSRDDYKNTLNYWKNKEPLRALEKDEDAGERIFRVDQKRRRQRKTEDFIRYAVIASAGIALTGFVILKDTFGPLTWLNTELSAARSSEIRQSTSQPAGWAAAQQKPTPPQLIQPVAPANQGARGSYASIQNQNGRFVMIEPYKADSPELDRMIKAERNAAENRRLLAQMEERDKQCFWWKTRALNYDLITIRDNVERYCRN